MSQAIFGQRILLLIGHLLGGLGVFCIFSTFMKDVLAESLVLLAGVLLIACTLERR